MAAAPASLALALLMALAAVAVCAASNVGLYLHLADANNVEVFRAVPGSGNQLVPSFGLGQVFDYKVTTEPSTDSTVVGSAQGFFIQASNQPQLEAFQEQFTVLFLNADGSYAGDSFSFAGVWVSDVASELFIQGGTGILRGVTGSVTLTWAGVDDSYSLDVLDAPLLREFLATRVRNAAFVARA